MSEILIRVKHPKGQSRINLRKTNKVEDLLTELSKKLNSPSENILLSFDNKRFTKFH